MVAVLCLCMRPGRMHAQNRIILASGRIVDGAVVHKEKELVVVYQLRYSLHDLMKSDIGYIETDSNYTHFDTRGKPQVKWKCEGCQGCNEPDFPFGKPPSWEQLRNCRSSRSNAPAQPSWYD